MPDDVIVIKGSNVTLREGHFANPEPLLQRFGIMMKGRMQSTFEGQGRDGRVWAARGVPNIAGLVSDATKGAANPPKRRFEGRPAGIDTRFLARSIAYGVEGRHTVRIGTTVQYAKQVHGGGLRIIPVTAQAKQRLYKWIKAARKKVRKGSGTPQDVMMARQGWLLGVSEISINPPPRPFAFFSDRDRDDIGAEARAFFLKPTKSA